MDLKEENLEQEEQNLAREEKKENEHVVENTKKPNNRIRLGLLVLLILVSMVSGYFIIGKINQIIIAKRTSNVSVTDPTQKPPDNTNTDPVIPKDPLPTGKVIFKIGAENITDTDLANETAKLKPPDFDQRMQGVPEKDVQVYLDQMKKDALKNLVNQIYFRLYLKDQKITITQADQDQTEKDLIEMMTKIHEQQNTGTPFNLEERLKQYNISMDTFKTDIKNQTIYRIATAPMLDKITATEAEAKLFFKSHPELYNIPAKADLKHILLTSEADADAVIKELNQGADFATLAKAKSKDPQAQTNGGTLGWISNDKAAVPEEILKVIFDPSTKLNTPLKIHVETQWYVMKVSGIQPEVVKAYSELADKAMFDVKENKRTEALDKFIKTLEAKYGQPIPQP